MITADGDDSLRSSRPRFAPGFRARLSSRVAVSQDGQVLLGGRPVRLVRVRPDDASIVQDLSSGRAVDVCAENAEVIGALLDRDFLQPQPDGGKQTRSTGPEVTVVIPVRDHLDQIASLLHAPMALAEASEIVVVDDASADAAALEAVVKAAAHPSVRVVRMDVGCGPAGARNRGAALARTEVIAFVDADCVPEPGWMGPLLAHFDDANVGAVAPRVRAQEPQQAGRSSLAEALLEFEMARGPLDAGSRPGAVGPGHRVLLVPSAALLVRRAAFTAVGGFDEQFDRPTGEDTDLEWRMVRNGWTIRYEPASVVRHPIREDMPKMLRQRYVYGLAEAALADRHPGRGTLRVEPANLTALVLAAGGRVELASLVGLAGTAEAAWWWRRSGIDTREVVRLRLAEQGASARGLALNMWTRYWPLALCLALVSRRFRRMALMALVGPALVDWLRRRPQVPPWRWAAFQVAEQLAAGTGVWMGCLRARNFAALVPRWERVPRLPEPIPPRE